MSDDRVERTKKEIVWWYEANRAFIPPFPSMQFAEMAATSIDLVKQITPSIRAITIETDAPSAYIDFLHGPRIILPRYYFSAEALDRLAGVKLGDDAKYVSLAMINGSLIHEALHGRFTHTSPDVLFERITSGRREDIVAKHLIEEFYMFLNVLEDFAIETLARNKLYSISASLNYALTIKNDFLFTPEGYQEQIKKYDKTFIGLFEVLVNLKNRNCDPYEIKTNKILDDALFDMMMVFLDISQLTGMLISDRADRVADFVLRLAASGIEKGPNKEQNTGKDGKASLSLDSGEGEGISKKSAGGSGEKSKDESEDVSKDDASNDKLDGESENEFETIDTRDDERTKSKTVSAQTMINTASTQAEIEAVEKSEHDQQAYKMANEFLNAVGDIIEARREKDSLIDFELDGRIVELDVFNTSSERSPTIPAINIDFKFIRDMMIARTHNEVPGEPKLRGAKIVNTRISRIATDGKIFGRQQHIELQKPIEVIIILDLSGSTFTRIKIDDIDATIADSEIEFSRAFFIALRQANIAVGVYAHSSMQNKGVDSPALVHIASYNLNGQSNTNFNERFIRAHQVRRGENYDGAIYRRVASKFSKRNSRKLIVVMSDGSPSGYGYSGEYAFRHTKNAIKEVRDSGIGMVCFSIGGVYEGNNRIFGREYNVDVRKGLQREFKRVVFGLFDKDRR